MMSLIMMMILLGLSMAVMTSLNPVKMSIMVLGFSLITFLMIFMQTGSIWIPCLLSMLFMGGIMLLFMIISSLMPNEKVNRTFYSKFSMMIYPLILYFILTETNGEILLGVKMCLENKFMFVFMMSTVMLYFFSFIFIISKNNSPLRSYI